MKRSIWIIIIGLCLTAICILEELLVANTLTQVNQMGQQLLSLSETSEDVNTEEIYNISLELGDFWMSRELLLCFFINYKDMNEMSNEIVKMISYSKNNIKEEFTTSLALLLYYCETFNHITGFNIQNIL